jgi:hypothetical protein
MLTAFVAVHPEYPIRRTTDHMRAYFGFGASGAGAASVVLAPNRGDIRFQSPPRGPGSGLITS